jgi:hypothetical protein
MYGLINHAVQGLISSRFGVEVWHEIRERAGVPDEPFVKMENYDDAVTFNLVAAATDRLKLSADDVLRAFGRYWTIYSAEAGYGELLKSAGSSFPEFVRNLDSLHTRVKLSFPYLQPPSFAVTEESANRLVVHYHSGRHGLTAFVVGLLEGLGERFGLSVEIQHTLVQDTPAHGIFTVTWGEMNKGGGEPR